MIGIKKLLCCSIDEDGIARAIFTIHIRNEERKYVVETKNGKIVSK